MREYTGFTVFTDSSINMQIARHMKIISDEITKTFGKVDSIILAGGFGRGEGSIERLSTGKVLPLKDYDIYVITDHSIGEKEYIQMIKTIHARLEIKSSWYFSVAPGDFNIGIQIIRRKTLKRLPPDISTIDLKMASKVIYGEDVRREISASSKDIPLSSGAIVLFNKIIALLEHMNPAFLQKPPGPKVGKSMVYVCGKTFIEMCTALSIMARIYEPMYVQRALRLPEYYRKKFPVLYDKCPDLPEKVKFFTELKIRSAYDDFDENPITLWFTTREYLKNLLRYYMKKFLNIQLSTEDLITFSEQVYAKLGFKLFEHYLHYNLREIKGYRPSTLPLISFTAQVYDNLRFIHQIWKKKGILYPYPMVHWRSPLIKIFSAAFLTLFGINEHGKIDNSFLDKAYLFIKEAYPYNFDEFSETIRWDIIRRSCVEAQKLYGTLEKKAL